MCGLLLIFTILYNEQTYTTDCGNLLACSVYYMFTLINFLLQYVLTACQNIKKTALWEVDVEVDIFHSKSGANNLGSGLLSGRTLVYSDLNHVVVRILPKYVSEAREQSILVSSHIDTVFSTYVLLIYLFSHLRFNQSLFVFFITTHLSLWPDMVLEMCCTGVFSVCNFVNLWPIKDH